jgi:hypothetical protein
MAMSVGLERLGEMPVTNLKAQSQNLLIRVNENT